MLNKPLLVAALVILLASFVVLAVFYASLPSDIIITRGFFGSPDTLAPKSLFTVFRVPLIDTVCAAAALMLYRKFIGEAQALAPFWLILLYTAAGKSLLQACELVSSPAISGVFFYLTLAWVVVGITAAFYYSRHNLSLFLKGLGRFNAAESLILILLFLAYLGLGLVPSFVYS